MRRDDPAARNPRGGRMIAWVRRQLFLLTIAGSVAAIVILPVLWFASVDSTYGSSRLAITESRLPTNGATWFIASADGSLRITRQHATVQATRAAWPGLVLQSDRLGQFGLFMDGKSLDVSYMDTLKPSHGRLGFGWGTGSVRKIKYRTFPIVMDATNAPLPTANDAIITYEFDVIALPYWMLLLAAVIAPAIYLRQRRTHEHRFRTGRCLHCGYDLRASTDRCPECGLENGRSLT